MKIIISSLIKNFLTVASTIFICGNAQAALSLPEREHAQTIVWIVEAVTFITAFGIALLVWRISKKDRKAKTNSSTVGQVK
jgi:hypothetical protein